MDETAAGIRPFSPADVAQVARLHRRVFDIRAREPADDDGARCEYLRDTFLEGPWCDPECPSLVSVQRNGCIEGFLGVARRTMSFDGRPRRVAVSSQFIVDDQVRSPLPAVRLLKAFLSGPQDLSLADEATGQARALWAVAGGTTAALFSLFWVRLLRPAALIADRAGQYGGLSWLAARATLPAGWVADAFAARAFHSPLRQTQPGLTAEDLDVPSLLACIGEATRARALRPEYSPRVLGQLLETIAHKRGGGVVHKVALRDADQRLAGWYIYHATPAGIGEVVQVGATGRSLGPVLDHLFYRAWQEQLTALTGRVDPLEIDTFARKGCFFHHRGEWVLVHSTVPGVLDAINRGDAFLTRLEGEWCLRFQLGPA